jgi:hypothetical protein
VIGLRISAERQELNSVVKVSNLSPHRHTSCVEEILSNALIKQAPPKHYPKQREIIIRALVSRALIDQFERMANKIICASPEAFQGILAEALATNPGNVFCLFTGAKNSGVSWCPDCTRAEPVIDGVLAERPEVTLIEAIVERAAYRDANYLYRTDAKIKLKCVPTLMRWNASAAMSLDDKQSSDEVLVRELFDTVNDD